MAYLETKELSFFYPDSATPALNKVQIAIDPGEFVVLCGPSGSGKSTLLRLLKKDIAPHGDLKGMIYLKGRAFSELSPEVHAQEFGFVFQDPENQLVMERVREELLFGMENFGLPTSEMRRRLAEMIHAFGLQDFLERKTMELSGGQKQLINLASVLLLKPSILLLDEPTAQLDPVAAKEFFQLVRQMNVDFGMTVVMVEHRLEDVLALADQFIVMDKGQVQYKGLPRKVLMELLDDQSGRYEDYLPSFVRLYSAYAQGDPHAFPLTVKQGRRWLASLQISEEPSSTEDRPASKPPLLEARHLDFQYERKGPRLLENLNFKIMKGDFVAIVGGNGTGKSTLLKVFAQLLLPQSGELLYKGKRVKGSLQCGYLPQNPKLFFLQETVEKELQSIVERKKIDNGEQLIEDYLQNFSLTHVRGQHPYDLSGGELQKAALIGVLLEEPELLLIDEPTKGLDPKAKLLLGNLLVELNRQGKTLVLVTHDVEFAARFASRCAMLFMGEVTTEAPSHAFFKGNTFYTTSLNRLTRDQDTVPEVVTLKEATETWSVKKGT